MDLEARIAPALEAVWPHDATGEIARKIRALADVARNAADLDIDVPDRRLLALVITGDDPAALRAVAEAYGRALHACGLVPGRNGAAVTCPIDWADEIAPGPGMDEFATRQHAEERLRATQDMAGGGALIVEGIYNDATGTTEPDFAIMAEEGGLNVLVSCMTGQAKEKDVPVVILTGDADRLNLFMRDRPDIKRLFEGQWVASLPAPPPEMATVLEGPLKVKAPLRFRPPRP